MKVKISIRGRRYTVRSDDEGIDLPKVAAFVDSKMNEMAGRSANFDEYTIAMLAALNIASEFERYQKEVEREFDEIDRQLASTSVLLESALDGSEKIED